MGNSGRFPQGKPAATVSRYPTLIDDKVHAGSYFFKYKKMVVLDHWPDVDGPVGQAKGFSSAVFYAPFRCTSGHKENW